MSKALEALDNLAKAKIIARELEVYGAYMVSKETVRLHRNRIVPIIKAQLDELKPPEEE